MRIITPLILFFNSTSSYAQIITFCIDKFQGFNYPISFSNVNDALKKDSIKYENSGKWKIEYTINTRDSVLIYNYISKKERDTLKIEYYDFKHENNYEIWALKLMKDTVYRYHYLLTDEIDTKNMVLFLRYVQGERIRGWFTPSIDGLNIKFLDNH